MLAEGVPSSFFSTMVPATAVYLISCPPMRIVWLVLEVFSSSGTGFGAAAGGAAPGAPG